MLFFTIDPIHSLITANMNKDEYTFISPEQLKDITLTDDDKLFHISNDLADLLYDHMKHFNQRNKNVHIYSTVKANKLNYWKQEIINLFPNKFNDVLQKVIQKLEANLTMLQDYIIHWADMYNMGNNNITQETLISLCVKIIKRSKHLISEIDK